MGPPDQVLLTRPAGRNEAIARRLDAAGVRTLSLPALELEPLPDLDPDMALPQGYDLVFFVSGNAARFYFDWLARQGRAWPASVRQGAVGASTALALSALSGVSVEDIIHPSESDSLQDSEAVWPLLQAMSPRLRRVLIVRGDTGREWLGRRLEQAGVAVCRLSIYRRRPAVWSDLAAQRLRRALQAGSLVCLLTSSESVDAVFANLRRLELLPLWGGCRYLLIHPRIQERLQSAMLEAGISGPAMVKRCTPDDEAILEALLAQLSHR